MVVTYFVEATLATVYLVALVYIRLERASRLYSQLSPSESRQGRLGRLLDALKGSAKPFLDITMVFSLAMNLSALAILIHATTMKRQHQISDLSIYTTVVTVAMTIFSLLPAILLLNVVDGLRRPRLRRWLMIILLILAAVVIGLSHNSRRDMREFTDAPEATMLKQDDLWDAGCDPNGGRTIRKILMAVYVLFGLGVLVWFVVVENTFQVPALVGGKLLAAGRRQWPVVVAGLCCLGMWILLGLFVAYRNELIDIANPSSSKAAEDSWVFGQYLALATFFPVFLDIGYISTCVG
jgi:hypothetical protein